MLANLEQGPEADMRCCEKAKDASSCESKEMSYGPLARMA